MIAQVALFLVTVSVVASAAAWCAEEGLRRIERPTRWMWLTAMAAPPVLLVAPMLMPGGTVGTAPFGAVVELAPLIVGPDRPGMIDLDLLVAAAWLTLSLATLLTLGRTHLSLSRERALWEPREVLGRSVYVSADRGPAIAGVLRPWIVLPRWVLALPDSELRCVVLHEEEHVRAGDAALLGAALSFLVLTPWNPLVWWQLRRLRAAMEIDCDRRVLRRSPDRRTYGESLLSVAARTTSSAALGLPAFSERSHSLERRIRTMTSKRSRWTPLGTTLLVAAAVLVAVQACGVESPVAGDEEEQAFEAREVAPSVVERPELVEGPTFTPFTQAPSILNRQEVVDAMSREYPPLLRDAGIGGTVTVWFFINEFGQVEDRRINQSSGHAALDDAALRVAGVYRFSPAKNRDTDVPVWVQFPITFQPS